MRKKDIKASIKAGRFTVASRDHVVALAPYIDRVLAVMGYPDAFVTDESRLDDFPIDQDMLIRLAWLLDGPVHRQMYIAELAERLSKL